MTKTISEEEQQLQILDPVTLRSDPQVTIQNMTVGQYFEVETRQTARYLSCNEDELVSEMNQLFKKCLQLIKQRN